MCFIISKYDKFQTLKSAKTHKNQNSELLCICAKMADFALLEPPKLISRKI